MARLSPFTADRERLARIAERYRKEADAFAEESATSSIERWVPDAK